MLVVAFSVFSGVLFANPSPSYAFVQTDVERALNRDINLVGADLIGANLRGARLAAANLIGADLIGADLIGARLIRALADSKTKFSDGFDAEGARVFFLDY